MRFSTSAFNPGSHIPPRFAAGCLKGGSVAFSDNLSPPLAWSDLPGGTLSLALSCIDVEAPSCGDDVNQSDREVPADLPRTEFLHWLMVDIPPSIGGFQEGDFSRGFTARGKPGPGTLVGARHTRNDYTAWFARDAELRGDYFGYDGPFPPFNDARVHRYVFTLYALSLAHCPVEGLFTLADFRHAIDGRVLAQASFEGLYTLNPRLAPRA